MNCPFCHSPGPHEQAGSRNICGKCGETFAGTQAAPQKIVSSELKKNVLTHRQMRQVRGMMSIRSTVILCVGFAMISFIGGVAYRWYFSKKIAKETEASTQTTPYAPLKIPALRFLPSDLDGILAVQLQHMPKNEEFSNAVATMVRGASLPGDWLNSIPQSLQTEWSNILELVLAVKIDEHLIPPQVFLVLHVKEPIDEDKIIRESRGRYLDQTKRDYLRFQGPSGLWFVGWKPVDKYFLVALDEKDLDLFPEKAKANSNHISNRLRSRIEAFCTEDMHAWLTMDFSRLPESGTLMLSDARPEAKTLRQQLDSLTIGLDTENSPRASLSVMARQEQTAENWRKDLMARFSDKPGKIQIGGGGKAVFLKLDFDPEIIGIFMQRLISLKSAEKPVIKP
ncbi:hypothetical protein KIH39_05485 [Telmatocola sphagniphila]|uniref:DUF3352 domain-containing protein n=1 Tax=Telmatocola sphagniphila TaxID=1123043 RepID=A0A8E6B915_9BACT|nr:hypothetical protein [Telmatocola sphagniphila]QVL33366.1 hypothetical protein KIH39_05485 [Telmatocola sphagniphila]